ncbi:MAG: hypothetical protein HRT57_14970 [Crocinitomicaceae bacterium]|nr:hypothetical protein [Crocinitomicaceae bacterium]
MKSILFIGLIAFAFGCANHKNNSALEVEDKEVEIVEAVDDENASTDTQTEDYEEDSKPQRPYQVKGTIGDVSSKKSDAYEILSARVEGNNLYLEISYTGGCAHHRFECIGSEAISKSLPPQRSIKLIHNDDNDSCESLVKQTIKVDIQPFALSAAGRSNIVLFLEGFRGELNYTNI